MRCTACGRPVRNHHCPACNMLFLTRCARCGNTSDLTVESLGGEYHFTCAHCHNETAFEVVPLAPRR